MTFSYTDDAIVSASPTGRHLSTVVKRPAVLMSGWTEHAEQICKALNGLLPSDKVSGPSILDLIKQGCLNPLPRKLYSGVKPLDLNKLEQRAGLVFGKGPFPTGAQETEFEWNVFVPYGIYDRRAELTETLKQRDLQVTNLRGQLDEATTKLCAAQMLLEQPVVVPLATDTLQVMYHAPPRTVAPAKTVDGRKVELKRV